MVWFIEEVPNCKMSVNRRRVRHRGDRAYRESEVTALLVILLDATGTRLRHAAGRTAGHELGHSNAG